MFRREESASYLARNALGLEPSGDSHAIGDSPCVWCGRRIKEGEPVTHWFDNGTFMDWPSLSISTTVGDYICCDCSPLWGRVAMQKVTKAVICNEGVYPVKTLAERAYFLLEPPEPPFLFAVSDTTNQQHIWWRTPVNHDRDNFAVQVGLRTHWIRRRRLLGLNQLVREFKDLNYGPSGKGRLPFLADLDGIEPFQGQLLADSRTKHYIWPETLRDRIETLSAGEIWALTTICIGQNPVKPTRLTLTGE